MSGARRRSGVLVPLFSAPSTRSWGCGEIGDISPIVSWLAGAGQRLLQLLPLNEMAPGDCSPYSAMSAMAFDPIYISLLDVPEFVSAGGVDSVSTEDQQLLVDAQRSSHVQYAAIRSLKHGALAAAFERFLRDEWDAHTARAVSLDAYRRHEAWWLDDYALFRALHDRESGRL